MTGKVGTHSDRNSEKRILISSPGASLHYVAELQRGIRRFTRERPEWNIGWLIVQNASEAEVRQALDWNPDGILVLERSTQVPLLLKHRSAPKVVVDLNHDHPSGCSRVEIDDGAIGREVARYFLHNHFEHFAVVVWPRNPPFSAQREQRYRQAVEAAGFQSDRFEVETVEEHPWLDHSEFDQWLLNLPKPVALFGVQNELAQRVLQSCRRLGIQIPLELSLVGLDAQEGLNGQKRPFISYLPQPLEEAGYRAVRLLDEYVQARERGDTMEWVSEQITPGPVVERQSSSLRAIPDPNVAKAAQYLWEHALSNCRISDAIRVSGMNRRTLERAFRKHLGVSPGEFIRERQIEHAKKLLTETDMRVWEISESCTFTQQHFIAVFRKTVGMTPHQYRMKQRRE